jgi:hypothetical protein
MLLLITACKITQPIFSKETNSDCYDKLIPTPLFKKLTEEDKVHDNLHSLQELKENSQREIANSS